MALNEASDGGGVCLNVQGFRGLGVQGFRV